MTGREQPRECGHWLGGERRHCKSGDGLRAFLIGIRCPAHTPSALAGRAEPGAKTTT